MAKKAEGAYLWSSVKQQFSEPLLSGPPFSALCAEQPPLHPLLFYLSLVYDIPVALVIITPWEERWKTCCMFLLLQGKLLSEMEIRYLLHLHIVLQTLSDPQIVS